MKNLNKIIVLIMACSLFVLLVGCGNADSGKTDQKESGSKTETETGTSMTEVQTARSQALKAAGVSEDGVVFTKVWKETDNGIQKWEVEFVSNGQKYEVELNASDGSIRESSAKPVVQGSPAKGCISSDEAKAAALKEIGINANQATFTEIKFETDDGIQKWELEFVGIDGNKYDFKLNAANGSVLETSVESTQIMR